MNKIAAYLLLGALSQSAWALDAADEQRLLGIQQNWAHIQYELPEGQRTAAFEKLAAQASTFTQERQSVAEAWIWSGIVTSSWAGAQGGLGALSKVKEAKVDLEKALALDPKALQGSAYTSLPRCMIAYPAGRSASATRTRPSSCSNSVATEPQWHRQPVLLGRSPLPSKALHRSQGSLAKSPASGAQTGPRNR
jgi:hypothetical protein